VVHHDWKAGPKNFLFLSWLYGCGCFSKCFSSETYKKNFIFKKLFLKLAHQNNLKYNKKLFFNKKNLNFKKHGCF
jgi:hypothetical protein